ncbi:hypothetical protein ES332_A10G170700v1 [Gossypium tomentosum]|uniref:Uncharacterized protein n=1 Tax=Gossypium tomentosum TaxID=34277 RepID=A0A5D2NU78_GOSTO|nr:hypothetical protein ES332_A10G170700v1 [Gossypium tomentosum]
MMHFLGGTAQETSLAENQREVKFFKLLTSLIKDSTLLCHQISPGHTLMPSVSNASSVENNWLGSLACLLSVLDP